MVVGLDNPRATLCAKHQYQITLVPERLSVKKPNGKEGASMTHRSASRRVSLVVAIAAAATLAVPLIAGASGEHKR